MKKKLLVRKEKPICKLNDLRCVKRGIDAYMINDVSDIMPALELGYACTRADNNGAINVWKDDSGVLRGELMRFCVTLDERDFASYEEMEKCVSEWIERIK